MVQLLKSFAAFSALTSGVSLAKTDLTNGHNRWAMAAPTSPFVAAVVEHPFGVSSVPLSARRIQQQMSTTGPDISSSSNPSSTSTKPPIVITDDPTTTSTSTSTKPGIVISDDPTTSSTTASASTSTSGTDGVLITTTVLATTSRNPPITDGPNAQASQSQAQSKLIGAGFGGAAVGVAATLAAVYGVKKYREKGALSDHAAMEKQLTANLKQAAVNLANHRQRSSSQPEIGQAKAAVEKAKATLKEFKAAHQENPEGLSPQLFATPQEKLSNMREGHPPPPVNPDGAPQGLEIGD